MDLPSYLPGSAKVPTSLATIFTKSGPESTSALKWAVKNSHAVDIDIRNDLTESDGLWEGFEELLTATIKTTEDEKPTPIILCKSSCISLFNLTY